jgi:hypothetical protein
MRLRKSFMGALAALALGCVGQAAAQQGVKVEVPPAPEKIQIESMVSMPGGDDVFTAVGGPNTFVFVNSEVSFDRKIVKGAPYSAESTTETIQTLGDGNRIIRKNSATIYRDSEGRTRREQTLGTIGQWTVAGDPPKTIFINDPVARVNYMIDPKAQTARKTTIMQIPPGQSFVRIPAPGAPGAPPAPLPPNTSTQERVRVFESTVPAPGVERLERQQPKVEQLGKQMMEGVEVEGTRTTVTIPAGKIGNERPIDIVSERWYSPELQVVVYSKRTDPMAGETTYKLTNINRGEPSRSLFEVPAGYTVKEGSEFNFKYFERKAQEERKAQQ